MKSLFVFLLACLSIFAQAADSLSVYPTNWWVGMKNPKLQLMLHGKNIAAQIKTVTINYAGVKVEKINRVENPNYLFIDLQIAPTAKAGKMLINTNSEYGTLTYLLLARNGNNGTTRAQGVTSADFIYLAMPDRFSNGNPANDRYPLYRDQASDRNDPLLHHGGDLQGITNHLDYLKELGVTAIWLCPVIENDMPLEKESA